METEAPPTQNIIEDIDESSLEKLYESVGIKSNSYQLYRLDAIHLRGTDDLSTDHIFEYFEDFEPLHIEWISDDSCKYIKDSIITIFKIFVLEDIVQLIIKISKFQFD